MEFRDHLFSVLNTFNIDINKANDNKKQNEIDKDANFK